MADFIALAAPPDLDLIKQVKQVASASCVLRDAPSAFLRIQPLRRFSRGLLLPCHRLNPITLGHGNVSPRSAARRGPRADQYRQDLPRHRAHARPSQRHDRVPAAAARPRELRPDRQAAGRALGCADHRRREDPAAEPVLFCVHRRIDAARPAGRFPGGRRNSTMCRSGTGPCFHRPPLARARLARDDVSRSRDDQAADAAARPRDATMSAGRAFRPCPIPAARK